MERQPMASDSKLPEYFGATELDTPATALEDEGGSERASQLEHTPDGISVEFLTEALRGRRLVDDIATAANGSGRSLFAGWREKVNGALNDGYAVYLHILSGGPAAV